MSEFNRETWLKLATSVEEEDQLEAIAMAEKWPQELQTELIYWLACTTSFRHRFAIYGLLDEQHQEKALQLISDSGQLTAFDRIEAFAEFEQTDELEMQQAIVHLERWYMKPNDNFRNALYLEYKNRKGCTMDQAKLATNRLFTEEPTQSGDDFSGGGRAPDNDQ